MRNDASENIATRIPNQNAVRSVFHFEVAVIPDITDAMIHERTKVTRISEYAAILDGCNNTLPVRIIRSISKWAGYAIAVIG